jgi:lipopolysaccharide/colanic/teichoic acid biosynthesis glycosyltransferase
VQGFSTSIASIADSAVGADLVARNAESVSIDALGISSNFVFACHCSPPKISVKRVLDLTLSLLMLCSLWPLMVAAAVAIQLSESGPVFYVSERIGRNGRLFRCYKFRTMIVQAELLQEELRGRNERDEILFKVAGDPRVTRVGRILRKYSVDELPQLLNVLRGEMSLIGPRPPLLSEVARYKPEHFARLTVLPGMTGLWQVHCRNSPSFADYINLDLAYIKHRSLWLDIRILWRTIGVVLAGTGI